MKNNRRKTKTTVSVCLNFDDVAVLLDICDDNKLSLSSVLCAMAEKELDRPNIDDILLRAKEIRPGRKTE